MTRKSLAERLFSDAARTQITPSRDSLLCRNSRFELIAPTGCEPTEVTCSA